MRAMRHYQYFLIGALILFIFLTACASAPPAEKPQSTSTPVPSPTPALTNTPEPTPTPSSPLAVLINPPEADQTLFSSIKPLVSDAAGQAGYRFQTLSALDPNALPDGLRLVVALPPLQNLDQLVQSAQKINFLAVNFTGLQEAPNLTGIGGQSPQPDQVGFMAGLIAVMITPDWRVGAITAQRSTGDAVAGGSLPGFMNGAAYFCGLCRPPHPPYFRYPLSVELDANASDTNIQEAVASMIQNGVETVFVDPEASSPALFNALNEAGIHMIGASFPGEEYQSHWVATLGLADPLAEIQKSLPDLLAGRSDGLLSLPLTIRDANPSRLSPGRQAMATRYLDDLLAGFISTGVVQP